MWKQTVFILCLLVIGQAAVVENRGELESEDDTIEDFYNLLDDVDESSLGEIENIITGDDDGFDDITDPDVMVVDPPPITEEDLPAVELHEDDDDDDDVNDDDEEDTQGKWPRGRGRGWKKSHWKKAKKWAKKMERGRGQRRRGGWRGILRRNESETEGYGRQMPSGLEQIVTGEVAKAGRRISGKVEQIKKKMEADVNDEDDDDDDWEETLGRRGRGHRKGRGPHRRGKHHQGPNRHHMGPHGGPNPHKGPHHKRGPHHKPGGWRQTAPLKKRVALICWKLQHPKNQRFLEAVQERHAKGIGNVDRKAYRIDFVEKMQECCKNNFTREQCFVSLTHQRYDNFCDNEMPLKPWARGGRRRKAFMFSSTCCEHSGQMRYSCFNGSKEAIEETDPMSPEIPEETQEEILMEEVEDDILEEDQVPEGDDEDDVVGGRRRANRRQLPPQVKSHCCAAGRKGAEHIKDQLRPRMRCMAAGRKFVVHRKDFKMACGVTFGRCCLHTVRRERKANMSEGMEHKPKVYDFTDEDDDLNDDITPKPKYTLANKGVEVEERVLPVIPEVAEHHGKHHKGKHPQHLKNEK